MKLLLTRDGLKPLHTSSSSSSSSLTSSSSSSSSPYSASSTSSSLLEDDNCFLQFLRHQFCTSPCKSASAVDLHRLSASLSDNLHADFNEHAARASLQAGKQPLSDTETVNIRNMMVQESSSFDLYDHDSRDSERRSSDEESVSSLDLSTESERTASDDVESEYLSTDLNAESDSENSSDDDESPFSGLNKDSDSESSSDEESVQDHNANQGGHEEDEEEEEHVGVEPATARHAADQYEEEGEEEEEEEEEGFSLFKFQFHELYSPGFEERRRAYVYGPAYPLPQAFIRPYSLF